MEPRSEQDFWPRSVCWHDVTMAADSENLALDEILLQKVDADPSLAILRTWEPTNHFVVVGRSNHVETEVDEPQCRLESVPIFRRTSGGGAVVVGPGCLAYALILPLNPTLRANGVVGVTQAVMEVVATALSAVAPGIQVRGTSDLVIRDRKFSGNSQRWLKNAFLHHGTILYDYDLPRIERLLRLPSREPDYRSHRPHAEFVGNIPILRDELVHRLVTAWHGQFMECEIESRLQARLLAASRYEQRAWNYER